LDVDETFSRTDAGGTSSYLTDALGSTMALAGSQGAIQTSYTYEPYGKATASGSSSTSSFGYTGREQDSTGLDFLRARYHNPTYGRFISEDPIGFACGPNLYGLVGDSPTNFVDPFGLWSLSGIGHAIGNFVDSARKRFIEGWDWLQEHWRETIQAVSEHAFQIAGIVASAVCIVGTVGACGVAVGGLFLSKASYELATGGFHVRTLANIGKAALVSVALFAASGSLESGLALDAEAGLATPSLLKYALKAFLEIGPTTCAWYYPQCP
jgi:RHS repeat-associated protein